MKLNKPKLSINRPVPLLLILIGACIFLLAGGFLLNRVAMRTQTQMSRDDTAFNADFVYGWLRNCFEGHADYLDQRMPVAGYPPYHAGDIWGCLGFWYSGDWYNQGAINYIATSKGYYTQKPWLQAGF